MLDDALRLTLDQIFEPKYDFSLNYKRKDENDNLETIYFSLRNKIEYNYLKNRNLNFLNNINNILEDKNEKKENKIFKFILDENIIKFIKYINKYIYL